MSKPKKPTKPLKKECDSLLRWTWGQLTTRKKKRKKASINPRIVKAEERSVLALIIDDEVIESVQTSPRLSAILLSVPLCVELPSDSSVTIGWMYDAESKAFSPPLPE